MKAVVMDDDTGTPGNDETGTPGRKGERAVGVETVVVPERGQWAVDIVVFFPNDVVRRRIATYRTEALAQISAQCIRRGAERDIEGPFYG